MPRKYAKKITRRRPKRRRYVRKYRRSNKLTLVKSPTIGGLPPSLFTRLVYCDNSTLNPGVGGTNAVAVYSANGIYDPMFSGGTKNTQPRGFDQWMTLYDHYYVKRSRIIVTLHNGDGSNEVVVGVALRDDTSTESDPHDYQEQNSKTRLIGRVSSSDNHAKFVKYFNWRTMQRTKYYDDQNKGTSSANPTEQAFYHVFCGCPWGADSTNTYTTVRIEYDVLFTELKDLISS